MSVRILTWKCRLIYIFADFFASMLSLQRYDEAKSFYAALSRLIDPFKNSIVALVQGFAI